MRGARALRRVLASAGLSLALVSPARASGTVNVELDYMQDLTHSHRPAQAEIDAVVQMFACHGITLNVVIDQAIPEVTVMLDGPDARDFFTATGPGTYNSIKSTYFQHLGQPGWHYCVFGHQYIEDGKGLNSSGLALLPGYDLVVTLGTFGDGTGSPWDRASSFAHELGHNLGLNHGGSKNPADVGNSPPVYASVMSYAYQLVGVRTHMMCLGLTGPYNLFKDLDYSNGRMPDVNEGALDESLGLGMTPVDWNCSGSIGGIVAHDLDEGPNNDQRWCDATGPANQVLGDWNDWATVQSVVANPQLLQAPDRHEVCPDIPRELRTSAASDCAVVQPSPVLEPAVAGEMIFVNPAYAGLIEAGSGNEPYRSFVLAYSVAPASSVFYLRPGTYNTGSGVLSTPAIVTGPGAITLVP